MSLSGNLKTVSFPDILQLLATGKKSGILEITTRSRQKEVAFRDGNIIYASSINSTEDLLGNMLLRRGQISKSYLQRAIALHEKTGRQLGATLVDMKLFAKEEIAECLRLQVEEIVYNLFAWEQGDFIFHEGAEVKDLPFHVDLVTMNVVMEGTRRIDEWSEIQKALPPDDVLLAVNESPQMKREEIRLTLDEFKMLNLINGDKTLPELVKISPIGEFVSYRALYRLLKQGLVEGRGKREGDFETTEDEERILLGLIFKLFNSCMSTVRQHVTEILGEDNERLDAFSAQYRRGLLKHFTGVDADNEGTSKFDKFVSAVRGIPPEVRYYQLMRNLELMLIEHLEFVYQLLGDGCFRRVSAHVKRHVAEPLAIRRELVKRFGLEESFYQTLRRADRTVKMIRA